jgi:hypothetical protein
MAHYAFLKDGVVVEVIVGRDEGDGVDWEQYYAEVRGLPCKRTSYNTRDGVHLSGGVPFRGTYVGIGYRYDPVDDVFVPPTQDEQEPLAS